MGMQNEFPFEEIKEGEFFVREFSKDVLSEELVWHRDREDRYVKIVQAGGWLFQMDNELPVELKNNQEIFIPKLTWHRVKRGSENLIIKIKKVIKEE